ncbi:FKBP-type peptidyl-prolyl cis-trans isomerase [soil metagenome]
MRTAPALLSALAVAAVVVTSLAGCAPSGSSSASASCTPYYSSGAASSTVKVTGERTAAATATFPTPLVVTTPQVSQNTAGTGSKIQAGDQVDFEYTVYNAKTGESLGSSGYGASGSTRPRVGVAALLNGRPTYSVTRSLQCATTAERYTLVTTAKAGFGAGALSQNGISDSDVLVIVVSVVDHFPGKSDGANLLPQDGLPSVITAVSGQPGIVLQEQTVPKDLRVETVKAGSGTTVKKNQTVHLKYTGWTWPTVSGAKPLTWDQRTWDADQAIDLKVTSTADGGQLPPGMYQAIVGAKVGSQVLVVIPPKDGFPSGSAPTGVDATSTLIMVIDVLGIT